MSIRELGECVLLLLLVGRGVGVGGELEIKLSSQSKFIYSKKNTNFR